MSVLAAELPRTELRLGRYHVDGVLVTIVVAILGLGLVMLTSASVSLAESRYGDAWHFLARQLVAVVLGAGALAAGLAIPTAVWERLAYPLLFAALGMLALVFVPGLGDAANGARRWITVGGVTMQVVEPARLLLLMYLAAYVVRHQEELATSFTGLLKPLVFVAIAGALLLAQPDFGSVVVLFATAAGVLFVGGARLVHFLVLSVVGTIVIGALAISAPYRVARLTAFLDPWADDRGAGYQLVQSLIAIGRGDVFGVGLGSSVQKLFYLPDAHTDFVFAVLAEEFGLVGVVATITLFSLLVWRAFRIGAWSARARRPFGAYLAFGIGLWLALQSFVNIAVNMGLLPTKGLPLPLVSYGRSALIVTLAAVGILLRIHHERVAAEADAAAGRRRRRR